MKRLLGVLLSAVTIATVGVGSAEAQQAGWSETKDLGQVTRTFTGWEPWGGVTGTTTYYVDATFRDNSGERRWVGKVPKRVYNGCQVGERLYRTKHYRSNGRTTRVVRTDYGCR